MTGDLQLAADSCEGAVASIRETARRLERADTHQSQSRFGKTDHIQGTAKMTHN